MHHATNYTQPTRTAENKSMITSTVMGMIPLRRLARVAFILLATVLLLAVSSVKAQAQAATLSRASVTVPEDGSKSESYGVRLDGPPTVTVTVTVTVTGPVKVNTQSLEFTTNDWNTYQTVTVTGLNDDVDNVGGLRSATITHGDGATLSVSVTDDDTTGLSIISETRLTVAEDGSDTNFFKVKLNSAPLANEPVSAEITATPADTVTFNDANTTSVDLMFTNLTWNRPQVVFVYGKDDNKDNPSDSRLATITVDPSGMGRLR